ncbi:MFS transporter [Nocardiopsis sp. TSRI0078]|uniref:MFS transporter n=1 Tax=unclassified Nocardiopsis TaxID=2649073 RepID=UPI00093BF286|nr:MFS transporter [Nocardiopsis sp. TSRI0078]OKI15688.1 MFS transporter [Nocardiopsis sp. TSRI0078]
MRRPIWLSALALAALAVQTDDFVILGVLPGLAADLRVSEAAAGQLVTVYSLTYALSAPIWALLLSRVSARRALILALAVFTAANLAVPAADGWTQLVALRVAAALAAAVVMPAALATAANQAPPGCRGRYLATVMTGLTCAVLLGVPAGTWAGAVLGWEGAFLLCGVLGASALALIARTFASRGPAREGVAPADVLRPLAQGPVAVLLAVTVLAVAGNLAFQTYVAPVLAALAGVTPRVLALLLVCSGAGGLLGTRTAGRLVDRLGPVRALEHTLSAFCATMSALALLWLLRPVTVAVVAVLLVCWSAAAWAVPPVLQALMLDRVGERAATQAMAVQSASVHVGAASGGALGGGAVAVGTGLVPVAAAVPAALALLIVLMAVHRGSGAGRDTAHR